MTSAFQVPDAARSVRQPKLFEWPRSSGRVALYSAAEQVLCLEIIARAAKLPLGSERLALARELAHLHDLKFEFGLDLCAEDNPSGGNMQGSTLMSFEAPFEFDDHGWLSAIATEDAVAYAHKIRDRLDEETGGGPGHFDSAGRWSGPVAEEGLAAVLEERGIPFVRNGGADRLPDFVVAGRKLGVKCQFLGDYDFKPHFGVLIPDQQRDRDCEPELLFAILHESRLLRLIGAMPAEEFFRQAVRLEKGDKLPGGKPVRNPVWRLEARHLETMASWLGGFWNEEGAD